MHSCWHICAFINLLLLLPCHSDYAWLHVVFPHPGFCIGLKYSAKMIIPSACPELTSVYVSWMWILVVCSLTGMWKPSADQMHESQHILEAHFCCRPIGITQISWCQEHLRAKHMSGSGVMSDLIEDWRSMCRLFFHAMSCGLNPACKSCHIHETVKQTCCSGEHGFKDKQIDHMFHFQCSYFGNSLLGRTSSLDHTVHMNTAMFWWCAVTHLVSKKLDVDVEDVNTYACTYTHAYANTSTYALHGIGARKRVGGGRLGGRAGLHVGYMYLCMCKCVNIFELLLIAGTSQACVFQIGACVE